MNEDESLKSQLKIMINKAKRSLAASKRLFNDNDFDFASSRAYYAVFYAIEGLLLLKNSTPSSHSGTISEFSKHYIKTGIFPSEFGGFLTRLYRSRQIGDYQFPEDIDKIQSQIDISNSEKILTEMINYLINNDLLEQQLF